MTTLKIFWHYLVKLKVGLLQDPASPPLGLHPADVHAHMHQVTCPSIFIIACRNSQELERVPMSIKNKMGTLWYIYTMKHIIKINITAMEKHTIRILSERSQTEPNI